MRGHSRGGRAGVHCRKVIAEEIVQSLHEVALYRVVQGSTCVAHVAQGKLCRQQFIDSAMHQRDGWLAMEVGMALCSVLDVCSVIVKVRTVAVAGVGVARLIGVGHGCAGGECRSTTRVV